MRFLGLLGRVVAPAVVLVACGSAITAGGSSTGTSAPSPTASQSHSGTHTPTPSAAASTSAPVREASVDLPDGGRVVTLPIPGGAYTPEAPTGGTDDYRCFLLDPQIAEDTFLTGVTFLPDNPEVVHHAILFRVPPDRVGETRAVDDRSPGAGWTCFGDSGIPQPRGLLASLNDAPWLSAWAPGKQSTAIGSGLGVAMPAGTQVVVQIHYNLLAGSGPDRSAVKVRLSSPEADLTALETMLLPAPVELPCAPDDSGPLCDRGAAIADVSQRFGKDAGRTVGGLQLLCGGDPFRPKAGPEQSCDRVIMEPTTVVAAAGHMHLLGSSIRIEKVAGDGTVTTLLDKPVWDFDDQGAVPLADPVRLGVGERLRVTCTHDPTLRDRVPSLSEQPDRYVVWGEGTSDEMCLGIVSVVRS